ncbi:MAG: CDP-alcohol phosphatidyltransferase family protein [Actinomycetota bacterium]|nr:CDP-alcohol phosphatidyltransferase family protein [Actinomycetota bacterium]
MRVAHNSDDQGLRAAQRYSPRALTDGERWTAGALEELRRAGYRPRGWQRFIRASLERSAAARRERPSLARQGRLWGAGGAIAWLMVCRATRRIEDIELSPARGLAWWLLVWQMLDWHLGMAEGGDGQPRTALSPADGVTLARFWLVPAIPACARHREGLPALIALAGATDWADGALARRYGRTRLGRDLDTTADLAFIAVVAISAQASGRINPLAFQAVVARYAIGVAIALVAVFGRARRPAIRARRWGALPRFAGLAMCTAGLHRAGTALVLIGCLVPPRSTAPHLSRA